jgi:hypothetical protein
MLFDSKIEYYSQLLLCMSIFIFLIIFQFIDLKNYLNKISIF